MSIPIAQELQVTEVTTAAGTEAVLQSISDRTEITDVLYRYASTIDRFDHAGIRSTLADGLWAQYGNAEPVLGGDAVAAWIAEAIAPVIWQHHLLSVYHVDVHGDHAAALVYHTSHQVFKDDPESAKVLVGRYHNELSRTADGWKISKLVFEILWGEARLDAAGYLGLVGGRGPAR
jgi:SnoaL-like domain